MAPIACVPETTRKRTIKIQYGAGEAARTVLSGPPLRDPMERLAVRLRARTQKREKTIVAVVSPNAGAGASTLAANLALALAGCGEKTLLLDANWRRTPAPAEPRSGAVLEKALARLGEGDAAPDVLALRTKGRVFEAEASASLLEALGEAARTYRWIVVDLNPLSCSADLDAIASDLTFVVLVVRAGRTTGPALEQASAIIPGDKKVALVLNRAPQADVHVCA
jgi:Mrp family chromosome partitioning ATPase